MSKSNKNASLMKSLKESEKARIRVERERNRLERERLKEEERKKKEEEKERKRLELKEKKDQEEKEKEEKRRQREEEKKQREEERKQRELEKEDEKKKKEEERKRKEEERLQKELEKKKEEEEKLKKQEKQRKILTDFVIFKATDQNEAAAKEDKTTTAFESVGPFKQFEVKKDMRLAASPRIPEILRAIKTANLNAVLSQSSNNESCDYLKDVRLGKAGRGKALDTWTLEGPEVLCLGSNLGDKSPSWTRAKLFQFVENNRPAYYGTWRKRSQLATGRRPFGRDTLFLDYEVDSDEEWEEEEPGEDISHSEGDDEEEEVCNNDGEEDDDGFFVPHGYLSEDEGLSDPEDDVLTPEMRKVKQQLSERQFEAQMKQKVQPLRPVMQGPRWLDEDSGLPDDGDVLRQYKVHLWLGECPITCEAAEGTPVAAKTKKGVVPDEAIPDLVHLLHNNHLSRKKISFEFRMFWERHLTGRTPVLTYAEDCLGQDWHGFSINKTKLNHKITELSAFEEGKWVLKPEAMETFGSIAKLDVPWEYITEVLTVKNRSKRSVKKAPEEVRSVSPVPFQSLPNGDEEKVKTPVGTVAKRPLSGDENHTPVRQTAKRPSISSFFVPVSKKIKLDSSVSGQDDRDVIIVEDSL